MVSRVDAGPSRLFVTALMARGMGTMRIAEQARVPQSTVNNLVYGQRGKVVGRIDAATEHRLLAVRFEPQFVDSTGTRRRVHALVAAGYLYRDVARGIGWTPSNLCMLLRKDRVRWETARRVRVLYEALEAQPGPSSKARARGTRNGWAPPLAWDEDTIDDPSASPADVVRSHRLSNRIEDLVEDVEWLVATGATWASACGRLEMRSDALERALGRAGRYDLIGRLRRVA